MLFCQLSGQDSLRGIEAGGKKLCWYFKECPAVPIMGCFNRIFALELFKIQIKVWLVIIYPVFDSPDQSFFKEKSLGLA